MLTHDGLRREIARRIERVQAIMRANGVGALVVVGVAGPGGLGAMRYISHAHFWGGSAYAVLGKDDPDPWICANSSYQAIWSRNETTTRPERVEAPDDAIARVAELARGYAEAERRVGVVNMSRLLGVGDHRKLGGLLDGFEIVELTAEYNTLRQIKTPFELEAMQQNGAILDASMDVFRERARPGVRYWEACAAVEAFVKAKGAFWGRTKVSLDLTPYTVPTARDRTIAEDDIITFEIVYESPWGYWLEMTTVFSFHDLPDDVEAVLQAYLRAFEASAAEAKPGNTFRAISDANDRTIAELGFTVAGKHTPDCHSTGLDGSDGPSSESSPDFVLKPNMVLSFHPGTVLENDCGFLISDNVLVTPEGGVRLSPHTAERYYLRLDR